MSWKWNEQKMEWAKNGICRKWNEPKMDWGEIGMTQNWNDPKLDWAENEISRKCKRNELKIDWADNGSFWEKKIYKLNWIQLLREIGMSRIWNQHEIESFWLISVLKKSQKHTLCSSREIKQNHKKLRRKRNADWRSQR